jgi:catalase (peroxidase I)
MTDAASFAVLEPATDGLRSYIGHQHDRPETPTNDMFVNLLHMDTDWSKSAAWNKVMNLDRFDLDPALRSGHVARN